MNNRREFRDFVLFTSGMALIGLAAGAGIAGGTLFIDRTFALTAPVAAGNMRLAMGGLISGLLTIAVFALWMRSIVVSLAAGEVSPRVAIGYLDDGFQQAAAAWTVGALTYLIAITLALPSGSDDGTVPLISSLFSGLVVVAALVSLLVAARHGEISLSPPNIVRALTDQALAELDRPGPPNDRLPRPLPNKADLVPVESKSMGWVRSIDYEAILERLPNGGAALVPVAVGQFVAKNDIIGFGDPRSGDEDKEALRNAVVIDRARDTAHDVAFAVQQLVDLMQHTLDASSDTSTAHEALVHLRVVLERVIREGRSTSCRANQGRFVVCTATWSPADYVSVALKQLRHEGFSDSVTARTLMNIVGLLESAAAEMEDEASLEILRDERRRLEGAIQGREGSAEDPA